MKQKLIQLAICPGKDDGSASCYECICRGKSECAKALKAEVMDALKSKVTVTTTATEPFNLERHVAELLHELGIPAHIKGYYYLREAIVLTVNNMSLINEITSSLYPSVARKFDTKSSRVERAIRHAVEVAFDRGDIDTLQRYFGNTISLHKGKPTNSEFIALVADRLHMEVLK